MRKIFWRYCVVFLMVVLSGGLLMQVSQHVQQKERDIKSHEHKIAREQENIRVLKAEWAYLNNPARLERLVSDAMALGAATSDTLLSDLDAMPKSEFTEDASSSSFPGIRQDVVFDSSKAFSPHRTQNKPSIFIRTDLRESGAR